MKKQKKIIIKILILLIVLIVKPNIVQAVQKTNTSLNTNTIINQEETFGISSFLMNAKQYTGEFFEDIDIDEILNSAIRGEVDNSKIYKKVTNVKFL